MGILTKVQRNAVVSAVAESGISLGDFYFLDLPRAPDADIEEGYTILHRPSGSHFDIFRSISQGGVTATARLGDDPPQMKLFTRKLDDLVGRVRSWAKDIPGWMDTPDLWKSMPDTSSIPGELTPESDNTPFTVDEQKAISDQLREIAESVKKTYELTAEQSAKLDEKFEEAEKASRRMGRKDWGMFFGGIVLSLVLPDIITPEVMGYIFMMIEHGLGHLFGAPPVGGVLSSGRG